MFTPALTSRWRLVQDEIKLQYRNGRPLAANMLSYLENMEGEERKAGRLREGQHRYDVMLRRLGRDWEEHPDPEIHDLAREVLFIMKHVDERLAGDDGGHFANLRSDRRDLPDRGRARVRTPSNTRWSEEENVDMRARRSGSAPPVLKSSLKKPKSDGKVHAGAVKQVKWESEKTALSVDGVGYRAKVVDNQGKTKALYGRGP